MLQAWQVAPLPIPRCFHPACGLGERIAPSFVAMRWFALAAHRQYPLALANHGYNPKCNGNDKTPYYHKVKVIRRTCGKGRRLRLLRSCSNPLLIIIRHKPSASCAIAILAAIRLIPCLMLGNQPSKHFVRYVLYSVILPQLIPNPLRKHRFASHWPSFAPIALKRIRDKRLELACQWLRAASPHSAP